MTVCPTNPNAATDCFWNMAGDATALAVGAVGFTFVMLFLILALTLPALTRY